MRKITAATAARHQGDDQGPQAGRRPRPAGLRPVLPLVPQLQHPRARAEAGRSRRSAPRSRRATRSWRTTGCATPPASASRPIDARGKPAAIMGDEVKLDRRVEADRETAAARLRAFAAPRQGSREVRGQGRVRVRGEGARRLSPRGLAQARRRVAAVDLRESDLREVSQSRAATRARACAMAARNDRKATGTCIWVSATSYSGANHVDPCRNPGRFPLRPVNGCRGRREEGRPEGRPATSGRDVEAGQDDARATCRREWRSCSSRRRTASSS